MNVFNQDKWQDTWSNDWDIANAIYDDPLGSGEQVLNGMWAPIKESYEHGGVDEAAARAVPSITGTILGGKGLTKLKELQHVDDATPGGRRLRRTRRRSSPAARRPTGRSSPRCSRAVEGPTRPSGSMTWRARATASGCRMSTGDGS